MIPIEPEAVDKAIGDFLRRGDAESRSALASTGEAGLRRILLLSQRADAFPDDGTISRLSGRDAIDQWTAAVAILAESAPEAYIEYASGRTLDSTEVSILGGVRHPGATEILCREAVNSDWGIRYNAIRSLIRGADPAGRDCIEAALADENVVVRSVAIKAVSRWDPQRAVGLYESLLQAEGLTPLLRQQATWAIGELTAGRPVRDPLDPI